MAEYILISFLVASLIVSPIFGKDETLSPSQEEYDTANAPEDDMAYVPTGEPYPAAPEPSRAAQYNEKVLAAIPKKHIDFLKSCVDDMSKECGQEVFSNILEQNDSISKKCCTKLLKMGYNCHEALVKVMFSRYELKNNYKYGITQSKKAWNNCVIDVEDKIDFDVSLVY